MHLKSLYIYSIPSDWGYKIVTSEDSNSSYIIGVSHIEKVEDNNKFDDDYEAQEQAKSDGIKLLTGFISIRPNTYLDTPSNRKKLQKYFTENPMYCIMDRYTLSKLLFDYFLKEMRADSNFTMNGFAKKFNVSSIHLSRIERKLIDITSSDIINCLLNNTDIDKKKLFECVEPIQENFIE